MSERMRNWFRKYAIVSRKKRLIRNKRFHSFDTAKIVGIVFKVEDGMVPPEVFAIRNFLLNKKIQCFTIGYCDSKTLPEELSRMYSLNLFTKQDVNWYGRPIAENVNNFLQGSYDIVIDLCRDEERYPYPLKYIVSTVQASLIIGGVLYPRCPYDLVVDAQQVCDTGGYIEQVKHYISIINNPQAAKEEEEEEEKEKGEQEEGEQEEQEKGEKEQGEQEKGEKEEGEKEEQEQGEKAQEQEEGKEQGEQERGERNKQQQQQKKKKRKK
jgi:hypothetical protein